MIYCTSLLVAVFIMCPPVCSFVFVCRPTWHVSVTDTLRSALLLVLLLLLLPPRAPLPPPLLLGSGWDPRLWKRPPSPAHQRRKLRTHRQFLGENLSHL